MPSPPADVAAAPFTPSSVQELEYDEVRFTIVRASVATVVAAILFRWTGERGGPELLAAHRRDRRGSPVRRRVPPLAPPAPRRDGG